MKLASGFLILDFVTGLLFLYAGSQFYRAWRYGKVDALFYEVDRSSKPILFFASIVGLIACFLLALLPWLVIIGITSGLIRVDI
jgi:uncharacterized membrane protein YphA (DoxX/SURF4 family)